MANDKRFLAKNGLQTPDISFSSSNSAFANSVTATFLDTVSTLSFSGQSGQLFSIVDSMSGTIFSVNDISGIPSIEVFDVGNIRLAEFSGNVAIGSANTSLARLFIQGNTLANGNITLTGGIIANGSIGTAGQALVSNGSVAYWTNPPAVTTSATAPVSSNDGDLWWDEESGQLKIYYNDGTSAQWVDASSATTGPPGPIAGSNTQVVFNDSGTANGSSGFTFIKATSALNVAGPIASYNVFDPIVVNDISNQFDGSKSVFDLKLNQDYITAVGDSKDLEVIVNGARLAPYVQELRWPWLTPYDSFQGFRVLNGVPDPNTVKLVLYNTPFIGDSASVIVRTRSSSQQQNRYPFSASTIALGD